MVFRSLHFSRRHLPSPAPAFSPARTVPPGYTSRQMTAGPGRSPIPDSRAPRCMLLAFRAACCSLPPMATVYSDQRTTGPSGWGRIPASRTCLPILCSSSATGSWLERTEALLSRQTPGAHGPSCREAPPTSAPWHPPDPSSSPGQIRQVSSDQRTMV